MGDPATLAGTDEAALMGALSIAASTSSTLPLSTLFADAQQSFMDIGQSPKSSDDPELQVAHTRMHTRMHSGIHARI